MTGEQKRFYSSHSRRLVKALTEELYESLYEVLREYICNGVDGHATEINITCRHPFNKMTITDNGDGINQETWDYTLQNFAISQKRGDPETIGMHGLGIYSGALLCKKIIVKTKTSEDQEIRVVRFPVDEWLEFEEGEKADDSEPKEESIQKGIYYYLSTELLNRNTPNSYTTVILSDLKEETKKTFTEKNSYKNFLLTAQKSWPLDFSPEFQRENSEIYNEIISFYSDKNLLGSSSQFVIKVYINGDPVYKWCPLGSKKSQLSYYPINKIPVEADGKTIAWIWWTYYKDKDFINKYSYIKKWLDFVEKKSKNELNESEFEDLHIPEEFLEKISGKQVKMNKLYVLDLIKKSESTKKLEGTFLRLKNVMIYTPTAVWDKILQKQRGRQWQQCWGEIFVVDNEIYPEMSRKHLRGKKLNNFNAELASVIKGEHLLGEITKYHHHGKKEIYKNILKNLNQKIKLLFEPSATILNIAKIKLLFEPSATILNIAKIKAESVETKAESVETKAESVETKAESAETKAESVETKAESAETEIEEEFDFSYLMEQLKPNEFDSENLSELKKTIIHLISSLNSLNNDEILEFLRFFTEIE